MLILATAGEIEGRGGKICFSTIFERGDVDEVVLEERQVDQFPGGIKGSDGWRENLPWRWIDWPQGSVMEKEMATHFSILAWEIPWTEEPGGLQFTGVTGVEHDLAT